MQLPNCFEQRSTLAVLGLRTTQSQHVHSANKSVRVISPLLCNAIALWPETTSMDFILEIECLNETNFIFTISQFEEIRGHLIHTLIGKWKRIATKIKPSSWSADDQLCSRLNGQNVLSVIRIQCANEPFAIKLIKTSSSISGWLKWRN